MSEGESLRLDKLLWFLRLAPTRVMAQHRIATGHIRLNGRRVERSAHAIRAGDVLTMPAGERVHVIEIVALPHRRGPALEAQACYHTLDALAPFAIAPAQTAQTSGEPPQ
jgi:ribosome-associated heat shock protein Hsp15